MNFTDKKVLVIGDIILDSYIEGNVSRISPEAPIPILDKQRGYHRLGGATNVAKNLTSLGAKVWIIGRIGDDTEGERIQDLLEENNINVDLLLKSYNTPTTVKTRFIANNHQLLRVDYEDTTPVTDTPEFKEALMVDLERHFKYFDAIIISDYNKGMIKPTLLFKIIELQRKYNKILTADTKKIDWNLFLGFTCLTPNLKEFQKQDKVSSLDEIKSLGIHLRECYGLKQLLVTLSERGLYLFTEKSSEHIPAKAQNFIDPSGCGDTVIAIYTLCLTCGLSPLESAILANKAGGIVVGKQGTACVSPEELDL